MESDEEIVESCTPPEIREAAQLASLDLLPAKSRKLYEQAYDKFLSWKTEKKAITSENCLIVYFKDLMEKLKPSTIWSQYSMLKSTIGINEGVQIKEFKNLAALLSNYSRGYQTKKAKVFSAEEVQQFLQNAPDEIHLATKVSISDFKINKIYSIHNIFTLV